MKVFFRLFFIIVILGVLKTNILFAAESNKLGVHILETEELSEVSKLFPDGGYITVPVRLNQLDGIKWQKFFDEADKFRFIPIIRFATSHNGKYWERPTKRDIINFADFFSKLDWHRGELIVIAFNEPNHAPEWGGKVDPDNYGQSLTFLVNWFTTEPKKYLVLPAALDAAAANTGSTMSANLFLDKLLSEFPGTIDNLSGWNSHAYPNPGFAGNPNDSHKMSVRSYQFELDTIKKKTGRDLPVYITETGWDNIKKKDRLIAGYFKFAYENIWNPDSKVAVVTPFLFNAQTMPFSAFSLLDDNEKPTRIYEMIKQLAL
ncbi:MAG: hypothetical protein UV19_C0022G0002 [Parcubacteria group bacterium GW2011_GWA2_42_28]|nr:MAG: hypothetical protein UV19_C0022G0002 [Parcubacteria group bacterium GW2011_GWA2_42_28]